MAALTQGLLDTSVLIGLDDGSVLEDRLPDELAISVASLAELHFGVLVAKDEATRQQRLRRLGVFEASFSRFPSMAPWHERSLRWPTRLRLRAASHAAG